MKHFRKLTAFTLVLMIMFCACLVIPAAEAVDKSAVTVKITFDKSSYAAGSTITASYSVSGGSGSYKDMYYYCYSIDNGFDINIKEGSLSAASGKITFTVKIGQQARVHIDGYDSRGLQFYGDTEYVDITGGTTAEPIQVDISPDKTACSVGTTVTATYKISGGSGSYKDLYYDCNGENNDTNVYIKSGKLTGPTGSVSFVPKIGQKAWISIGGYDSDGRAFYFTSEPIILSGSPAISPVNVKFTFDKSAYALGSTAKVSYEISGGSGSYTDMWYACYSMDGTDDIFIDKNNLSDSKGTITFTPKAGQKATVLIGGYDSTGLEFTKESDPVSLTAAPDPTAEPQPSDPPQSSNPPQQEQQEPNSGIQEQVTLKKVKISKVSAVSKKKIKVFWKKLSKKVRKTARNIQVQVSTDKNFGTIVAEKILKNTKTSVSIGGLKKNTKYYVRIRVFTEDGKTRYVSPWSSVKKVKTKKK